MRNPNGWGSVHKLPGNRRKPWRVRVTKGWEVGEDGTAVQKFCTLGYFETKEAGMIALAEYNANPYDIDEAITFAELYERWSSEKFPQISDSNVKGYRASYNVCGRLYGMKFVDIRLFHLQQVVDECGKNYPTLKKLKTLFSQLYTYAMRNDIAKKDYSEYVDIARHIPRDGEEPIHKMFQTDELLLLWENAERSEYIAVVLMLIYSGVRVSELLTLKKEDVRLSERNFTIVRSKTNAGRRVVPIAEKVVPFWEYWMDRPGEYVINSVSERKISYSCYLRTYFLKPLRQIGIIDHLPHDTRHTCISMMVRVGVNEVLIKRIVGHQGKDVTDRVYTHFDVRQLVDAINTI